MTCSSLTLLPETLVQVLGLLLSLSLGFRYSQAYSRWWEARVLWGALVNQSRNWRDLITRVLPRQLAPSSSICSFIPSSPCPWIGFVP